MWKKYMDRPKPLKEFEETIHDLGGHLLYVGGCVRDWLLKLPVNDYDVEVYGLNYMYLANELEKLYRIDLVGASFGILKVWLTDSLIIDVGFPRTENRVGAKHTDFEVSIDPFMSVREALARRDFTINAIAYDPRAGHIIDPYDGEDDLKARILRHVSDKFSEDPLRVLRGVQFAGRFNMTMDPATADLCSSLLPQAHNLPKERIWAEWWKWATKSLHPAAAMLVLVQTDWFKTVEGLRWLWDDCDPVKWNQTELTLSQLPYFLDKYPLGSEQRGIVMLAALLCETTAYQMMASFHQMGMPASIARKVKVLAESITSPVTRKDAADPYLCRQLAYKLATPQRDGVTLRMWLPLSMAYRSALSPTSYFPELQIWSNAEYYGVTDAPEPPILSGHDLINSSVTPGPSYRKILADAYDEQLSGGFADHDDALDWLSGYLASNGY